MGCALVVLDFWNSNNDVFYVVLFDEAVSLYCIFIFGDSFL